MTRFWRVVGFGCACFALGLGWLVVTGAGPGSDRRHGADCVVAQSRPGRVLGDRCFALDARGLRISVTRGVTLDDLQPFSDVVDLTIFIEDDDVDLAKLRDHPELAHVRVQGPLEQGTVVGAGLDILPLRDLPRLRSVEFAGLGGVDLRALAGIEGLAAVRLLAVDAEHLPNMEEMDLRHLELSLVTLPPAFELGVMEELETLKLGTMPEVHEQIAEAFPNLIALEVRGELSEEAALAAAVRDLEMLTDVEVWDPAGRTVQGRAAVLDFLAGRIE